MNKKNYLNSVEIRIKRMMNFRSKLSSFEKQLEAAKLVENVSSVDVDNAYFKVSNRIQQDNKIVKIFSTLTRIAAILTLPLLAFTIWSLFFQNNDESPALRSQNNITWQAIQSPVGMRSHIVLPDGTNLWLNAESQVRYSTPFIRESREIEISGEAFLDVVKDEQSPFVVKAGNTEIEVLGTKFNVNAWPETDQIQVALQEGKVKFQLYDTDGRLKYFEMQPNDLVEYNKSGKTIIHENTNIEKYIAWYQNILILDDTPLTELAKMLERWYGVKVVITSNEIKRYKFTTTFDNEPLHRVLELLEISSPDIKFTYTTGKPIKGTKKFSPSTITISKV